MKYDADFYPEEALDEDQDDGTMPNNVEMLRQNVVGQRIVQVVEDAPVNEETVGRRYYGASTGLQLTLSNGRQVYLIDSNDCCAATELSGVIMNLPKIDHVIIGVGTTESYTKWHIFSDLGDVLELGVDWTCGNPFYYGYGFDIHVVEPT